MATGHTHIPGPLSLEVGNILVKAMSARSLTRADVAEHSGISEAQLSRALRGIKVFTLEQLDAVCQVIEVSIADVIDDADRATSDRHDQLDLNASFSDDPVGGPTDTSRYTGKSGD